VYGVTRYVSEVASENRGFRRLFKNHELGLELTVVVGDDDEDEDAQVTITLLCCCCFGQFSYTASPRIADYLAFSRWPASRVCVCSDKSVLLSTQCFYVCKIISGTLKA
jgi:hypothetical protein